jgi:glutamate carboxypeptidase
VLVPEPATSEAGVVTGRYAIARFNLETVGRPSHAGARLAEGRSAIRAMARKIIEIEAMTSDDCTFSVGVVHGSTRASSACWRSPARRTTSPSR